VRVLNTHTGAQNPRCGGRKERQHTDELAQRVLLLDDSDPEKIWAGSALRGARDYKDEVQQQFNAHKEKHLQT
jgi:hypothetical protein